MVVDAEKVAAVGWAETKVARAEAWAWRSVAAEGSAEEAKTAAAELAEEEAAERVEAVAAVVV